MLKESSLSEARLEIDKMYNSFVRLIYKNYTNEKLNKPEFRFQNLTKCFGKFHLGQNMITLDRDVLANNQDLKETVWHELIHWLDYELHPRSAISDARSRSAGHGAFFQDIMKIINEHFGEELITVSGAFKGNNTYKNYYVYIIANDKDIVFFNSKKYSQQMVNILMKIKEFLESKGNIYTESYILETSDLRLKESTPTLTPSSKISFISLNHAKSEYLDNFFEANRSNFKQLELEKTKEKYWIYATYDSLQKEIIYFWSTLKNKQLENYLNILSKKILIGAKTSIIETDNEYLNNSKIKVSRTPKRYNKYAIVSNNYNTKYYNEIIKLLN